ncbi:MAG: hydroxyacylglutathione hydrolase [Solirubrobacteraceae bacterium]|nr:hydroxyacylglutathione hydrolase [Solirubrobacteraceae bacterium]
MILERSLNPQFLSNTYLVAPDAGGEALFIDAGGPMEPLFEAVERHGLTPTVVLLTHHHYDHVSELDAITGRWPDIVVYADEREGIEGARPFADGAYAGLDVSALHTPGHTAGMLSFVIGDQVFTGDTLFKNSVGGVRAPGHTTFEDLRSSIMDKLLALPAETTIRPGHTDPTTVADELEHNPFVRLWRGVDEEGSEPCTAMGEPATLVLLGDDYDGGHKAWVRWPDGSDDIVRGSQVTRG